MKGTFIRKGMTIVPAGEAGTEALRSMAEGKLFVLDIKGSRNPKQMGLFWGLCGLVADADDDDKEVVKRWLLRSLGYVDCWFDKNGRMYVETKSIAFENMEQAEFSAFLDKAIHKVAERLGSKPADVRKRFEEMVTPKSQ